MQFLDPFGCKVAIPMRPWGSVYVPHSFFVTTLALNRRSKPRPCLCENYLTGSCPNGAHCKSLHIQPGLYHSVVVALAELQRAGCCSDHTGPYCPTRKERLEVGRGPLRQSLAFSQLMWTEAIKSLPEPHPETPTFIRLSIDSLCLAHLHGVCKNGTDCRRLHVCRRLAYVLRRIQRSTDTEWETRSNWRSEINFIQSSSVPTSAGGLPLFPWIEYEDWGSLDYVDDNTALRRLTSYMERAQ
jgi:hypothetical protein